MLTLDDKLYFHNMRLTRGSPVAFWNQVYEESGVGGKFYIDIARRLPPSRFVTRNGEWTLPWPQDLIPGFEMPAYDPNFKKDFAQVTDERAIEIKERVNKGERFAVMYSGGIDSTTVLVSLIKNLTETELKSIIVCGSVQSIIEYPSFWNDHIDDKLTVLDSNQYKYDDLIEMGITPITADEGDCIFGTSIGLQLYNNFEAYIRDMTPMAKANLRSIRYKISDPEVHYSAFKDIIIKHLALDTTPHGQEFGRLLYEKYHRTVTTGTVPVHTLHDFFWWLIFNVKYLNCSVRGALYYQSGRIPVRKCIDSMINWFNGEQYQLWSMNNNNNGTKIRKTLATYKYAAREYIRDLHKDDWYFYFKTKLESLNNLAVLGHQSHSAIGVDKNYEKLMSTDPNVREYFRHHLVNYKVDWCEI